MAVLIVRNPRNSGLKKNQEVKKSAEQKVRENGTYFSYKKLGTRIEFTGDIAILVGLTSGKTTPKAKAVPYADKGPHEIYYYRVTDSLRADLPKNVENVAEFAGGVRIYADEGCIRVIPGESEAERFTVFRSGNTLLIRIGKSMKELEKEQRKKDQAEIGVWRA